MGPSPSHNISADSSSEKCDVCQRQNKTSTAVSYCKDCEEKLCQNCDNVHRNSKVSQNHTLLTGEKLKQIKSISQLQDTGNTKQDDDAVSGQINYTRNNAPNTVINDGGAVQDLKDTKSDNDSVSGRTNYNKDSVPGCVKDTQTTAGAVSGRVADQTYDQSSVPGRKVDTSSHTGTVPSAFDLNVFDIKHPNVGCKMVDNLQTVEMSRPSSDSRRFAIAAIDFGTTCTGYAYYFRKEAGNQIQEINTDQAWIGSSELGLQAPTTVLMDPDKKFHSFGFEAESKYKTLTLKKEHRAWFYFQHFKMKLHHEKKHLMEKLKKSIRDEIGLRDIKWVLTVPAIWRHSAKQFMREAASKAGIPNDQLTLALEPESVAIFCKEVAINKAEGIEGVFLRAFDPGEKYIVVDLGGGTVDTTGHEVLSDGSLKELHAATGGPFGGQTVNEAFEQYIAEMVTPKVFEKFCNEHMSDWIEFKKDFEKKKRSFSKNTEEVDLNFPVDLDKLYRDEYKVDLASRLKDEKYKNKAELLGHSLLVKAVVMEQFFSKAINELIGLIQLLLKKKELKCVSSILLVGGFSESPLVSLSVTEYFSSLRVIAPGNASVAILKGAIMFRNNPRVISSRISPFTYGVHTRKVFNPATHPQNRRKHVNGKDYVDNAFDIHIKAGEHVYVGGPRRKRKYKITNRKNAEVFWKVYQSDNPDTKFCDEQGCVKLGRLELSLSDDIPGNIVSLTLSMTCRGTELEASAAVVGHDIGCRAKFEFLADQHAISDDEFVIETEA